MEKSIWVRKILGALFVLFFFNSVFIFWFQEVYSNITYVITIGIFNGILVSDVLIRQISSEKDKGQKSVLMILSLIGFLIEPFFPYIEFRFLWSAILPFTLQYVLSIFGICMMILGGILELSTRIYIGKYGGPKIVMEKDHQLMTTGPYKIVRHPMYFGMWLLLVSYCIAFCGFITTMFCAITFYIGMKARIKLEESLLLERFKEEYERYMKKTNRFFPSFF